jgi:predicted lactoylglutathione lyase
VSTKIFVNLPVRDLGRSVSFFTQLGFGFDAQFTDEYATSMVISEDIYVMLLVEDRFKEFTTKRVSDATVSTEVILALSADSRERVDDLADQALAAGAKPSKDPMDEGFMYVRSFEDLDGHLWEIMWMDPSAIQR